MLKHLSGMTIVVIGGTGLIGTKRTPIQTPPSSTQRSWRVRYGARSTMDPKKHTALATSSTKCLAIIMPSAQTRVRPNPRSLLAVFVVNTDEKNLTTPDKK
jgi:hypothetical protein